MVSWEVVMCHGGIQACKGGAIVNATVDSALCTDHGMGPYCSLCEVHYFRSLPNEYCQPCPSGASFFSQLPIQTYVFFGLIIIVGVAVAQHFYRRGLHQEVDKFEEYQEILNRVSIKFKIAYTSLQIVGQFPVNFDLTFPPLVGVFADSLNSLNIDIFSVVPTSCMMEERHNLYYQQLLTVTTAPLAVCLLLFGVYLRLDRGALTPQRRRQLKNDFMTVGLLFTFTIIVSVSSTVFGFFATDTLDDGRCFLRWDYGTSCDGELHSYWTIFAVLMIFVYPLGIPCSYFLLLWQSRDIVDPIVRKENGQPIRGRTGNKLEDVEKAIELRNANDDFHHLTFICGCYVSYCIYFPRRPFPDLPILLFQEPQFWYSPTHLLHMFLLSLDRSDECLE